MSLLANNTWCYVMGVVLYPECTFIKNYCECTCVGLYVFPNICVKETSNDNGP
jgi:hypothetical protein